MSADRTNFMASHGRQMGRPGPPTHPFVRTDVFRHVLGLNYHLHKRPEHKKEISQITVPIHAKLAEP